MLHMCTLSSCQGCCITVRCRDAEYVPLISTENFAAGQWTRPLIAHGRPLCSCDGLPCPTCEHACFLCHKSQAVLVPEPDSNLTLDSKGSVCNLLL
jgi:hypothetical protein